MLGANPGLVLDRGAARTRLAELAAALGVQVDPDVRAGSLALGQQQHIEIIKALWKGSRVLILDEPTSMLTPQGIAELQEVLRGLKARGLAIIFITHKLHEAIAIGDRVAVLKQGRVVGQLGPDELAATSPQELQERIVTMMFGEAACPGRRHRRAARAGRGGARAGAPCPPSRVLELVGVSADGADGQHGIQRRLARRCTAARSWASRASTATASARWRRSSPASDAPSAGDIRLAGRVDHRHDRRRRASGWACGTSRTTASARGSSAGWPVSINLVLKRIGQAPFWRPRQRSTAPPSTPPRGSSSRSSTSGRRRRRHASASSAAATSRRRILARELVVRAAGGRVQQADPRPGRADHRRGPRAHPGADPARRRRSSSSPATWTSCIDLCDRVAVLVEGRIVGHRRQRPGCRDPHRRADRGRVGATSRRRRMTEETLAPDPGIESAARDPGPMARLGGCAGPERRAHRAGAAHRRHPAGHHRPGPDRVLRRHAQGRPASGPPACRTPSPGWRPSCSSAPGSSSPSGPASGTWARTASTCSRPRSWRASAPALLASVPVAARLDRCWRCWAWPSARPGRSSRPCSRRATASTRS